MKIIKTITTAAAMVMFVACSDETSTFNAELVPGRCTIEGKCVYNEGAKVEGGRFVYTTKACVNMPVTVSINNSYYGSYGEGSTIFETETDSQGNFSIEVPATAKHGIATITLPDFKGERSVVMIENNKVVTKKETVVYSGTTDASIHAQGITYANINCLVRSAEVDPMVNFATTAQVNLTIGRGAERRIAPEPIKNSNNEITGYRNAIREYYWAGNPNTDLIIEVNYMEKTFVYNATTNAKGEVSLKIPVAQIPAQFSFTVTAPNYTGSYTLLQPFTRSFTNVYGNTSTYTDYSQVVLNGYYIAKSCTKYANFEMDYILNFKCPMMVFEPYTANQETFGYSSSVFTSSLPWE